MNALMSSDPAQFSILFPIAGVDFNILELLIWAAFVCGVAFSWRKAATSWSTYFGALAIVAGVAFVTVIVTTQFMTLDEGVITTSLLDPTSRAANQLHSGALKVGMLVALPATIAMQSLGFDGISIKMALKAAWWLFGNLGLIVMAWTVMRLAKPEQKPAPLATAFTYAALAMLPTAHSRQNRQLRSRLIGRRRDFAFPDHIVSLDRRAANRMGSVRACDSCSLGKADSGRVSDRGNRGSGAQAVA